MIFIGEDRNGHEVYCKRRIGESDTAFHRRANRMARKFRKAVRKSDSRKDLH